MYNLLNIIIAIILVLFIAIIAPKLPKSIALKLDNIYVQFFIFTFIAFIATKNITTAIIAVIAVLISLQTLSMHKITDKIFLETNKLLQIYKNNNNNNLINNTNDLSINNIESSQSNNIINNNNNKFELVGDPNNKFIETYNKLILNVSHIITNNNNVKPQELIDKIMQSHSYLDKNVVNQIISKAYLTCNNQQIKSCNNINNITNYEDYNMENHALIDDIDTNLNIESNNYNCENNNFYDMAGYDNKDMEVNYNII